MSTLSRQEISDRAPEGWRLLLKRIQTTVQFESYTAAGEFIGRLGALADEGNHHPGLALRWPGHVELVLTSHDVNAVTERDLAMAYALTDLAVGMGATLSPGGASVMEVALDALDIDAIRPFWVAVLGYVEVPSDAEGGQVLDLRDPRGQGPNLWFQQLDEPRTERNRFHLDITVPHDEAKERLDAALAAGGELVRDDRAPAWWVLRDTEGNEACICTWQART